MSALFDFRGKNIAVFGLGKSGRGTIDFLLNEGSTVFAWDDNAEECKKLAREMAEKKSRDVTVAPPDTYLWGALDMLVLSPGIPLTHPEPHAVVKLANAVRCPIVCDIELLYLKNPDAKYIGITGTNGKSTTTALTSHIIKQAGFKCEVGGNIGVAASSLPPMGSDGIYVLEVSSYQLDLLDKTRFNIAVLLNITPDHIDRHGDMAGYIAAKKRIFRNQTSGDFAVIAVDDENTRKIEDSGFGIQDSAKPSTIISVSGYNSHNAKIIVKDGSIYDGDKKIEFGKVRSLPGEHNQQNIACAYAACKLAGIPVDKIIEGIKTYPGLEHRIEYVSEIDGIAFVNDSKATNADSTSHALKSFENIYWIAGGKPKEGGIESLENLFSKVSKAFLIGAAEEEFAATLDAKIPFERCGNIENATKAAFAAAKEDRSGKKPIILLSPACASFDQFKNFEERGRIFKDLVKNIEHARLA